MPVLEVEGLVKSYGSIRAVDGLSFSVNAGEILVIVGGSGCGKTTTLRCIAGLEDLTEGAIRIEGRLISSKETTVPPERRGIGMVFQSYALWPHKTVLQNVSYGLERKGVTKVDVRQRAEKALAQVGLSGMCERYPNTLSGGQQQRVALARSAVLEPRLLLLDEPLSNLDAKLREQMREELREMINLLNMTAVHITHDQNEAMALADILICLRNGRVEQVGTPQELYRKPATRFVAEFIGACNFLEGHLTPDASRPGIFWFESHTGLRIEANTNLQSTYGAVTLAIRPEAIELEYDEGTDVAGHRALILKSTFMGSYSEYLLELNGIQIKAHSSKDFLPRSSCLLKFNLDQAVWL